MNVGNIAANLTLNIQQFMAGLNQAMSGIKNFGNQMQQNWNGFSGGARNASSATKSLTGDFKDLDRMVSGIMISQAFYKTITSIKEAAGAVVHFKNELENAQVSFEYFLGNADKAKAFILNMQDFAATTTGVTTEQALTLSRRLMGAQFKPENIRSVMTILNDSSAATGATAEQLDRIVLALTQVKTNGKLAGQEVRQFAEAGIPIYALLREQLGLTKDQLSKIGKLHIDGDLAVQGILTGLEQRYKGASLRIAQNLRGMWETIKDDTLMVGNTLFDAPYQSLKGFVKNWRDGMETMRATVVESGVGGVFEKFIPKDLQEPIRRIVAGFIELGKAAQMVWTNIKPMVDLFLGSATVILSYVIPAVANMTMWWAHLQNALIEAYPWIKILGAAIIGLVVANVAARALMFLWSVTRLGVICTAVAEAVMFLGRSIQFVVMVLAKNPLAALFMLIAAAVLYTADALGYLGGWLDVIGQKLGALGGINTSGILAPDYNKSLADQIAALNKSIDTTAGKLTDVGKKAGESGKKIKDSFVASFDELYQIPKKLDDITGAFGALPDMNLPKLPEFGADRTKEFKFRDIPLPEPEWKIPEWLKKLLEAGIAIRLVRPPKDGGGDGGGPDIEITDNIAEVKAHMDDMVAKYKKALEEISIATLAWATLMAVPLVKVAESFSTWVTETSAGFATWVTNTANSFTKWSTDMVSTFTQWATETTAIYTGWVTANSLQFAGWLTATAAGFATWATNVRVTIEDWAANTRVTVTTWATNVANSILDVLAKTKLEATSWATDVSTTFTTWATNLVTSITAALNKTAASILNWVITTEADFSKWKTNIEVNVATVAKSIITNVEKFVADTKVIIHDWVKVTANDVYNWASNIGANVAKLANNVVDSIATMVNASGKDFKTWWDGTASGTTNWVNNVLANFGVFANGASQSINAFASSSWATLDNWMKGTSSGMSNWANNLIGSVVSFAQSAWSTISDLAKSAGHAVGAFSADVGKAVSGASASIGSWVSDNKSWLVPVAIGAVVTGAIIATVATGGAAAPALAPLLALETGGIVDRDQLVRIGEGNRREAVIPLQNDSYMRPFSAAVASDLADLLGMRNDLGGSSNSSGDPRTILYVGTLIADDRGLKELDRKMQIIRIEENARKGLAPT